MIKQVHLTFGIDIIFFLHTGWLVGDNFLEVEGFCLSTL